MLINQLAQKYAQALYELAQGKDSLDQTEEQLKQLEATIAGHTELAALMYHPRVPAAAKKETISQLFAAELSDYVLKFILLLIDKHREALLPAIVTEYIRMANKARNIIEAEVITALPLTSNEHSALAGKLSLITGKQVLLKTAINKSILGGVIVRIGDKLIDGSVKRQLQMMQAVLMAPEATKIGVTN